jgi:hypothetical protein
LAPDSPRREVAALPYARPRLERLEGQEGLGKKEQNVTKNWQKFNFFASNQLYVSRTCVFASSAQFSVSAVRK